MAVGRWGGGDITTSNQWSIPTNSEKDCEIAGKKFVKTKIPLLNQKRFYACVKGK